MSTEDKAQEHIEKLRRVLGGLGSFDSPVDDDHYKLALLGTLPREYKSLFLVLENLLGNLPIEDTHALILHEEARRNIDDDRMVLLLTKR